MNVVAIIQARMGSTRLPGKSLAEMRPGGPSMLALVVARVGMAKTLGKLVVATSTAPADDAIDRECHRLGVRCFRGSEADVLDRYAQAAIAHRADAIVRITADCPLIDPGVIDRVVGEFVAQRPDYASNTLRRTYPRGLDTEVFTAEALNRTCREATEPYQRAHVTPYIYQHPERFQLRAVVNDDDDHSAHRWTVDTPEDLALVRAIVARLGDSPAFSWREVLRLFDATPELAELNQDVWQKPLQEG